MTKLTSPSVLLFALCGLALLFSACGAVSTSQAAGSRLGGTYENAQGNASIEFMPGGKAHFSFHGLGGECTYKVEGNKLTLNVQGEVTVFRINEDGSLTGPPDSFLSRLKKKLNK